MTVHVSDLCISADVTGIVRVFRSKERMLRDRDSGDDIVAVQ